MNHPRPTTWLPSAALVAVTCAILLWSPNFRWTEQVRPQTFGGDALQEWLGSSVARTDPDRLYERQHIIALQHDAEFVGYRFASDAYFPMVYPPFYYVALRPLSYVSARQAAYVLLVCVVLCAMVAFWLLARIRVAAHAAPYRGATLALAILYVPLLISLCTAQKSAVVLLIFTLTHHLYRQNRRFAAGAVLGLLCFKPQLVLVTAAVFLWRRDWRLMAGMTVCGSVLLLLCLPVGFSACLDYAAFAKSAGDYWQTGGYDLTKSHSLYGFFQLMLSDHLLDSNAVKWATWMGLIGVGVLLLKICKRRCLASECGRQMDLLFAAIVLATPLASPHFYTYDLAILILPMYLFWKLSLQDHQYRSLGWLAALLYAGGALTVPIAKATGIQISVLMMVLSLWWLGWLSAYRPESTDSKVSLQAHADGTAT